MNAAPYGLGITICLVLLVVLAGVLLWLILRPDPDEFDSHEFEQSQDVFTDWDDEERAA